MTHEEDEAARSRKLKIQLGYDPDDPNISVEFVNQNKPVTGTETNPTDDQIATEIIKHLLDSLAKYGFDLNTPEEGIGSLQASLNRLWRHVENRTGSGSEAATEAYHLAASAIAYIMNFSAEQKEDE